MDLNILSNIVCCVHIYGSNRTRDGSDDAQDCQKHVLQITMKQRAYYYKYGMLHVMVIIWGLISYTVAGKAKQDTQPGLHNLHIPQTLLLVLFLILFTDWTTRCVGGTQSILPSCTCSFL